MHHLIQDVDQSFYWDQFDNTTMGRYLLQRESSFAQRSLERRGRPLRVLEVATGSGRMTEQLLASDVQIVGIDRDGVAAAAFQRRVTNVPLVMADSHCLPFARASFDCVIAIQCFQFFEHHTFLQECHRVLADHGLLVMQALNRRNYKRGLRRLLGVPADAGPSGNFTYPELACALAAAQLGVIAVSGYNWGPFDRWSDSSLVGAAALIERVLHLDRAYTVSPWLLIAAHKLHPNQP